MGHALLEQGSLLVMSSRACPEQWQGCEARAAGAREVHVLHLLDGPCPAVGEGRLPLAVQEGLVQGGRLRSAQSIWLRNRRACRVTALVSWEVSPAGAALEQLDQFTPEHLSRLLWAYSTLRIYSPELYSAVSSVAMLLRTGTG